MNKFFIKLDRLAAWILMAVIILYAVSGYGMTKGLINPDFARFLHLSWLGGVGIIAFIIHTYWAIHLTLRRRQIWNRYSRSALITFYVLLAGFFLYVHFFYTVAPDRNNSLSLQNESGIEAPVVFTVSTTTTKTNSATTSSEIAKVVTPTSTNSTTTSSATTKVVTPSAQPKTPSVQPKTLVFTATTLAAYDGLNGRPAYVAVDGIVYNLSSVFRNGRHEGHQAGQDLSAAFHSQHSASVIRRYPVVGTYQP